MNELKPHNIEAEQSVLGSVLYDGKTIHVVRDTLRASDFFIERHGWIYDVFCYLSDKNKPIDLLTVGDELQRRGQLDDIGGYAELTHMINVTPISTHIDYYGQIVKEASTKRQLIGAAGEISRIAHNGVGAEDAIQQSQSLISGIASSNLVHKPQPVRTYTSQLYDHVEAMIDGGQSPGLKTGLADLDRMLGGLKPGKLYLVAGRPAMGKSSLGLQMATYTAKTGAGVVLYFSLEMPGMELSTRMVSAVGQIDGRKIENGTIDKNEKTRFASAISAVSKWSILIDDRTRTIEGIRARATLQASSRLDLIIVDYVQRVQAGKGYNNRDSEIGAVSDMLKNLSIDLNVPVVAISSLNRQCESRPDKRPLLSDLRESGNLEYDADVVMFVYRDEVYAPNTDFKNIAELKIAKHRGGSLGTISLFFRADTTQFLDLETRTVKL